MAEFEPALKVVLDHEGGAAYTDHPADRGGPTKWGVTLAALSDFRGATVKPGDVEALSFEEAAEVYRYRYWAPIHGDDIADQRVATKCLDIVVNMGLKGGAHVIQLAAVWAGQSIILDDIVGANTVKAMNAAKPEVLLNELRHAMRLRYFGIAALHPEQNIFLKGWLNRADWGTSPVSNMEEGLA